MTFLQAAAEALRSDYSIMPNTCEALGLARGASYADGAAAVLDNRQTWSKHFGMIFRGSMSQRRGFPSNPGFAGHQLMC